MTCFAASYAVAFGLELTRLFLRIQVRTAIAIAMAAAGLLAHGLYLYARVVSGEPVGSWYHWCLLAAWLLAAVYVGVALTHPKTAVGLFMLPLILLLVAAAYPFRNVAPFPSSERYWGAAHGILFLAGAVVVMFGFITGVMYLIQSYRLKHKLPPRQGLRLPSLEWLQRINSRAMIFSICLLGAGFLSGIVLNVSRGLVPWTDPTIVASGLLLAWLFVAALVELFYKSARQGSKVAYLTVASFVFLVIVLAMVLFGPTRHAGSAAESLPKVSKWKSEIRISKSETSTNDRNLNVQNNGVTAIPAVARDAGYARAPLAPPVPALSLAEPVGHSLPRFEFRISSRCLPSLDAFDRPTGGIA